MSPFPIDAKGLQRLSLERNQFVDEPLCIWIRINASRDSDYRLQSGEFSPSAF